MTAQTPPIAALKDPLAAPVAAEMAFLWRLAQACERGMERCSGRLKAALDIPAVVGTVACLVRLNALLIRLVLLRELIMTGRLDQLIARWTARKAAAATERGAGQRRGLRAGAASPGAMASDQMLQQVIASMMRSLRSSVAAGQHHPHEIVDKFCHQFNRLIPSASRLIGLDWAADALKAIKERNQPEPEPSGAGKAAEADNPPPSRRARLLASASAGALVLVPKLRFASG